MENRFQRLATIREIIVQRNIHSQEDLLNKLKDIEINVTQATLSRDLKHLKVGKVPDGEGGYKYVLPDKMSKPAKISEQEVLSMDGFLSIDFSGNTGVIKTFPAFSHSIALAIDEAELYEILGTLAGNDTILIILREGVKHEDVIRALKSKFSKLEGKI